MNRPYTSSRGVEPESGRVFDESLAMKVKVNYDEHEVAPHSKFRRVVKIVRDLKKDDPMIQSLVKKTGSDQIIFVLNGRIIREKEYDTLELKEGDDIRYIHPFFGG